MFWKLRLWLKQTFTVQIEAHTHTHTVYIMTRNMSLNHVTATMTQILWCNPESTNMTFRLILPCFFLTWRGTFLCTPNAAIRTEQSKKTARLSLIFTPCFRLSLQAFDSVADMMPELPQFSVASVGLACPGELDHSFGDWFASYCSMTAHIDLVCRWGNRLSTRKCHKMRF